MYKVAFFVRLLRKKIKAILFSLAYILSLSFKHKIVTAC